MPQASLPESPLGPANPAEDRITLLNLPTGRHGPPQACQPKMMVLLTLSALRDFLSSLMPPGSSELSWHFKCPSLGLVKALSSWQDKWPKTVVGP